MSKSLLRTQMRSARRSLSPQEQTLAAQNLFRVIARQPIYLRAKNIALYFANDGEISPHFLFSHAWSHGKHCFVPAVTGKTLEFREYRRGSRLRPNRFGIAEPQPRYPTCSMQQLDLVLMPLVAFDKHGNRLGMGGGFYDRAFAFKQRRRFGKPHLIGLAHALQEHPDLPCESWDIPLNAIATDRQWLYPSQP